MKADQRFSYRDLITGISMATILIPFSMAYSVNAGLPVSFGLYAAAIPPLMYLFFGTSPYLSVGPVAMLSLIMFQGCSSFAVPGTDEYIELVLLATFLVGLIQFMSGLLRAGFLMSFLSHAVINGFTYGAALVIFTSQFRHVLGIEINPVGSMVQILYRVFLNIRNVNFLSLALGITSIVIVLGIERKYPRFPAPLVVVFLGGLMTFLLKLDARGVRIAGEIGTAFPAFTFPFSRLEMIPSLLPIAFTLFVVGMMESVPISSQLASRSKLDFHIDDELKGLGLANLASSFLHGYVVTGGLARTLFNYDSGTQTRISSIITSALVRVTLLLFRNILYYIPQPVLSSLIMSSAISLYMTEDIRYLYRARKTDGTVVLLTFLTTILVGVQWGLVVGILLSLVMLLQKQIKPCTEELGYSRQEDQVMELCKCTEQSFLNEGVILRAKGSLHFANIHYLEDIVHRKMIERSSLSWILLDLAEVDDMDGVAVMKLEELVKDCAINNIALHISGLHDEVESRLNILGWPEKYGSLIHEDLKGALQKIDPENTCNPFIRFI